MPPHHPRLAVFDLDGTLLGPNKEISVENADTLSRLQARGVTVLLASGRPHNNVARFHQQLGLRGPIVSGNGALVKDAASGAIWHQRLLDQALARQLLGEGHAHGLTQIWDGPQGVLGWERTRHLEILETRTRDTYPVIGDPRLRFPDESPFKILWIADEAEIAAHEAAYRKRLGEECYITITDPEYLEFSAPGVNKASGLAVVAERLGIAADDVAFFGDGDNDAELLAWAGLGVAMPHSRPKALAAADVVGPEADESVAVAAAVLAFLGV